MDGAAKSRIKQRSSKSTMYSTDWIIMIFRGFGGKYHVPLTQFFDPHTHQYNNGRRWHFPRLHSAQIFKAAHGSTKLRPCRRVFPGDGACTERFMGIAHGMGSSFVYKR